ncbi:peptidoglycan editing factor PgeF [Nocardioides sp.]|uniref:peptidoglycan editing factor PgeF n=1 Tax=Nocardioides sp. TaxID=35761 RepID=UPI00356140F3
MYAFRTSHGPVDLAFTDRHGGASGVPFDSLNLALEGDDDPEVCATNLRLVIDDFAPDDAVFDLRQVHGAEVDVVEERRTSERPQADGIVTTTPGAVLVVRVADCVPVLLADDAGTVVAAVHSGRPGLAAGVVPATVARMRDVGAGPLTAWIGPHVCGACYEVPTDLQAEVAALEPASRSVTSWGTPALDLGAGVRAQLERLDVRVVDVSRCTRESPDLFSYRRDGSSAGRLAGLVRIRP